MTVVCLEVHLKYVEVAADEVCPATPKSHTYTQARKHCRNCRIALKSSFILSSTWEHLHIKLILAVTQNGVRNVGSPDSRVSQSITGHGCAAVLGLWE